MWSTVTELQVFSSDWWSDPVLDDIGGSVWFYERIVASLEQRVVTILRVAVAAAGTTRLQYLVVTTPFQHPQRFPTPACFALTLYILVFQLLKVTSYLNTWPGDRCRCYDTTDRSLFCVFGVLKTLRSGYHGLHPEQPGHLAARLLAGDPDIKPRHLGDVISTGKLLSPNVYLRN
jgi:hypothetical protein